MVLYEIEIRLNGFFFGGEYFRNNDTREKYKNKFIVSNKVNGCDWVNY